MDQNIGNETYRTILISNTSLGFSKFLRLKFGIIKLFPLNKSIGSIYLNLLKNDLETNKINVYQT
ncbi:hypothetical protein BpHYR1_049981 [Brachionus plicatilis]|uniref:Uncharacterized protein n=1 Tax=Brachionus plicatilis TaxID=10195 RepID=A0A3M7Q1R7_BRAPC|nr:hypothetical protein BpHYR1_049981 [Brachionus plicatilis]